MFFGVMMSLRELLEKVGMDTEAVPFFSCWNFLCPVL